VPAALSSGSPLANEPMPVPKSPPPGRSKRAAPQRAVEAPAASPPAAPRAGDVVNELMPFLEFVEHHPIGTSVNGIVETYSSHGAYISIGTDGVRGYIPLRLMSDPPPTSARKVMQIGEAVTAVVVSFAAARRSIDCALPDMAGHPQATAPTSEEAPARPPRRGRAKMETRVVEAVIEQLASPVPEADDAAETPAPAKRGSRKRTAARAAAPVAPDRPTADAEVSTASSTGQDTVMEHAVAEKAPAKKSPANKAAARKAPAKKAPAKKSAVKKAATKRPPAEKAPAKRTPAKKTTAAGATTRRTTTARTTAARTPARRTTAK
jgi:hypothetical protein